MNAHNSQYPTAESVGRTDQAASLIPTNTTNFPAFNFFRSLTLLDIASDLPKMEIVGAVASFIAIAQALKGGQKALNFLRSLPEIEGEWKALNDELEAVGRIIDEARQYRSDENPDCPESDLLCVSINRVEEIANALVTLSQKCSRVSDQSKVLQAEMPKLRPKKTKWLWVKDEVRILHIRLRDAKTTLLMAVQLAGSKQVREIPQAVCEIIMPVFEMKLEAATERTVRELAQWVGIAAQHPQVAHLSRQLELKKAPIVTKQDSETELASNSRGSTSESHGCHIRTSYPQPCVCRCHQAMRDKSSRRARCNSSKCRRLMGASSMSGTIVLGHWLFGRAISLTLGVSLRPRHVISLYHMFHLLTYSHRPSLELLQQAFEEFRPDDVDERGYPAVMPDHCFWCFQCSRVFLGDYMPIESRVAYIEMALRIWGQQLENGMIDRGYYFEIRRMLRGAYWPESTRRCLETLASFSDEHGANFSTPIHVAIFEQASTSAVRAVIHGHQDLVNTVDENGQTPIHLVISNYVDNPRPLLFELAQAGADIQAHNGRGKTPLHEACTQHDLEAVEWLLQQGADPNKSSSIYGSRPLHAIASRPPHPDSARIAQLLISKRADYDAKNNNGCTPLYLVASCDLDSSSATYSRQLIAVLIKAGAHLDLRALGRTSLHESFRKNSHVSSLELIQHGADVHACASQGQNLIHIAAQYCDAAMLHILREAKVLEGVNPYHNNSFRESPWDVFVFTTKMPWGAVTDNARSSSARCLAYEMLFVQVRSFYLHEELDYLEQVESCLLHGDEIEASAKLTHLVTIREPKIIWSTDATIYNNTYRTIIVQIQDENVEGALDSTRDKRGAILEELSTSPWAMDSSWWHRRVDKPGATDEEWNEQEALARKWQKQGIRRWRREHPVDWTTPWVHPGGCVTDGLFEIWEVSSKSDSDEDDTWSDGEDFT